MIVRMIYENDSPVIHKKILADHLVISTKISTFAAKSYHIMVAKNKHSPPASREHHEGMDDESHLQTFERQQTDLKLMDYLEYKGYKGSVEYSKEDNCLFGKVQGLPKALILYEGQTLEELRRDFEDGIDDYIEGCRADGIEPCKPFSGRLNLRMTSDLHSRVAAFAASTGTTINDFINRAIQNEMAHQMAV